MKSFKIILFITLVLLSLALWSCSENDDSPNDPPPTSNDDDIDSPTDPNTGTIDTFPDVEGLEVLNAEQIYNGLTLVNDAGANRVYLMDKKTDILFEWDLNGKRLGNDVSLLPNGKLLAMLESESPQITLGGFGGVLAIIDENSQVEWSFEYSSEDHIAHHDAVMMPNGNILFLSWEKKSEEEATAAGFSKGTQVIYDAVLEINPSTDEIVWEWHMWDHIIQDFDDTKFNFGVVADNPQLIDINYFGVPNDEGDVSHANGLAYDADKDIIYISANFYSEVWVIDHSTSPEEAKSASGGNYGKGGNLIYRFGNPEVYDNTEGERRFDRNHHPNLLSGDKKDNMLIFANGFSNEQSTVYELKMPSNFDLTPNFDNEPEEVWSFTDTELYSGRVSGAVLLPNGNRLITEGDYGFWEVTESGEIVWRYTTPGFFWRGYHFDFDDPALPSF